MCKSKVRFPRRFYRWFLHENHVWVKELVQTLGNWVHSAWLHIAMFYILLRDGLGENMFQPMVLGNMNIKPVHVSFNKSGEWDWPLGGAYVRINSSNGSHPSFFAGQGTLSCDRSPYDCWWVSMFGGRTQIVDLAGATRNSFNWTPKHVIDSWSVKRNDWRWSFAKWSLDRFIQIDRNGRRSSNDKLQGKS